MPTGVGGFSGLAQNNPAAQSAFAVKQAKRLFVSDLPPNVEESDIAEFFNRLLESRNRGVGGNRGGGGGVGMGRPVVNVSMQRDQPNAFVEFRTPEETTKAIQFDGVEFFGNNLKIRRPREYVPASGLDILPSFGLESGNKVFLGDLPTYLTEEQVRELLSSFGELKVFHLTRDENNVSKGYAFCEYLDQRNSQLAIDGLNGMQLAEKKLICERASSIRAKRALISEANITSSLMMILAIKPEEIELHPVMLMVNCVQPQDLQRDEDYEDICADIEEECSKYGQVVCVHVPRPDKSRKVEGVGKVFVEFKHIPDCKQAAEELNGRRFNDRVVVTGYYPRSDFYREFYDPNTSETGVPDH
jgi:splicing factor U2AF 65 kDa subunit